MGKSRPGCYDPGNEGPQTTGVFVFRPSQGKQEREPGNLVALLVVALTLLALGVVGVFCYQIYFSG